MTLTQWKRLFIALAMLSVACKGELPPKQPPSGVSLDTLKKDHEENIGPPHIEQVTPMIFAAVGYDLANIILVHTPEGNVIVDTAMSPARAKEIKDALLPLAPRPIKAVIYTHSHIDHVGGASVWVEKDTPIWATEDFTEHFLKQYALFAPTEQRRGRLQFGEHVPPELLPCPGIGRCVDFEAMEHIGVRMPTRTFTGQASFTVGGIEFDLIEAHGETHDMLFVWIPSEKALLCGDNFYRAFPNLYTIRGTTARPVDKWIASLDTARALAPEHLVPSHTRPISGRDQIFLALTDYRDAIQWVRDETVRGANAGRTVDALAEEIKLPDHLARSPYVKEIYGQVDWSVRGIYGSNLGWFDGRPEALYPLPSPEAARREIAMMGGADAVMAAAIQARDHGDTRWAVHLFSKLQTSRSFSGNNLSSLLNELTSSYEKLGAEVSNINGIAYLYGSAYALAHPDSPRRPPALDDELLRHVPLRTFFQVMAVRLIPQKAMDIHESMQWVFPDEKTRYVITVRHGVAEIAEGDPLPGTPSPIATLTMDGMTWRRIAIARESPVRALASRKIKVKGSWLGALRFFGRFVRGY